MKEIFLSACKVAKVRDAHESIKYFFSSLVSCLIAYVHDNHAINISSIAVRKLHQRLHVFLRYQYILIELLVN